MNEVKYLKEKINVKDIEEKEFLNWLKITGVDKCIEIYQNFIDNTLTKEVSFKNLFSFYNYDTKLSEILFTILRHQENYVKAFLCNVFNNYPVQIEERPSNYTKTKYYFKIPTKLNDFLDIRTYSYTKGPVDYYDAIKTLDFGDINLIFSHLDNKIVRKFSDNPNIISELDATRKMRNYVYHHNMLFSLGRDELIKSIIIVLKNLPNNEIKEIYIKKINELYKLYDRQYAVNITENIAKEILE
jgi:hypothetical protein